MMPIAHCVDIAGVTGSSPVPPTNTFNHLQRPVEEVCMANDLVEKVARAINPQYPLFASDIARSAVACVLRYLCEETVSTADEARGLDQVARENGIEL